MKRIAGEKGYTLVEVMVAAVLIGIAVIPLVSLISGQLQANKQAGKRFVAVQAAKAKIEEIFYEIDRNPRNPNINLENNLMVAEGVYRTTEKIVMDSFSAGSPGRGNMWNNPHSDDDRLFKYVVTVRWGNPPETVTLFTYYTSVKEKGGCNG